MTGFGSPCGACKFLRRKCVKGCIFAPYFCHEQGAAHFAAIHKIFGASNVSKLLMHLPVNDRCEAAVTISYEAQARLHDPIYGCVAHIFAQQGEATMPHPTMSSSSVKNESPFYFGNDILTSTSMQSSQSCNPHLYTPNCRASFNDDSNPSCTMDSLDMQEHVQRNGYYDTEDLQSVAFAYLNQTSQDDVFSG